MLPGQNPIYRFGDTDMNMAQPRRIAYFAKLSGVDLPVRLSLRPLKRNVKQSRVSHETYQEVMHVPVE